MVGRHHHHHHRLTVRTHRHTGVACNSTDSIACSGCTSEQGPSLPDLAYVCRASGKQCYSLMRIGCNQMGHSSPKKRGFKRFPLTHIALEKKELTMAAAAAAAAARSVP